MGTDAPKPLETDLPDIEGVVVGRGRIGQEDSK